MSSSPTDTQTTTLVDVEMPQLGVSVSEGTLVVWRKQVGDRVAYEEAICDVATDKIDVECPSPAAGVIAELLVEPDQTVPVGTVMARIRVAGAGAEVPDDKPADRAAGEPPSADTAAGEVPDPSPAPPSPEPMPSPPHPGPPDPSDPAPPAPDPAPPAQPNPQPPVIESPGARAFVSPVVRRIADEHGIDPAGVPGSGRLGRVTKRDILRALRDREEAAARAEAPMHIESPYREDPAPAPAVNGAANGHGAAGPAAGAPAPTAGAGSPPAPAETPNSPAGEPLTRVRRLIGEHMRRSLDTAAHCTTIFEADMSAVERRRAQIGTTYLPVVARCVVESLREHPTLNAWLQDDRLVRHDAVHLGIAVDLGDAGLVVPVIRDAQRLSDEGLQDAIRDLARRARSGALEPGDTDGGTFTITNPGAFGAIAATPVINLPQVAILDLEAVVKRPVVVSDADGADAIAIRPMTNLCLSWDHRALDGAAAARFLATLRERLERV